MSEADVARVTASATKWTDWWLKTLMSDPAFQEAVRQRMIKRFVDGDETMVVDWRGDDD